jgi:23S rRNA (cytosine1962-C5)-methyltransferase
MFADHEYQLLDFGHGRKLERFGHILLDRPAPAANDLQPALPHLWNQAATRFEISTDQPSANQRGRWIISGQAPPDVWVIRHGEIQLELKLTPFGHVGVFPEQAENWDWLAQRLQNMAKPTPCRILNLFAYTGGSTLSAAAAGAEVTHVDSARNMVAWARRNAELSGLSAAPIRWITDDALKFARRELKRGRHYDAVILDPPSYGHGSGGEVWKLDEHLPELLSVCRELTGPRLRMLLLTCHAPNYDAKRLTDCLITAGFAQRPEEIDHGELSLRTSAGQSLNAGHFARVSYFD